MGYAFAWGAVFRSAGELASGLLIALELAALSGVLAALLGLGGAVAARSSRRTARILVIGYVELMRNSPSLVKMYFIYFGLPELGVFPTPFWSGVAALSLHNAAYQIEVFRAALASLPQVQTEAARSLGLGPIRTFRTVLWPQAFPRALPGLGNIWSEVVKDTALTSALSVRELFYTLSSLLALNMRTYEFMIVVGLIYVMLTTAVAGSARALEAWYRRVGPGERT